jgi:hypothetical protein
MNGQSVKELIALAVDQSELNIDPEYWLSKRQSEIFSQLYQRSFRLSDKAACLFSLNGQSESKSVTTSLSFVYPPSAHYTQSSIYMHQVSKRGEEVV